MTDRPANSEWAQTSEPSPRRVLYPVFGSESEAVIHIGASLAQGTDAELVVGDLDDVTGDPSYDTSRELAKTVFKAQTDGTLDVRVQAAPLAGSSVLEGIVSGADTYDAGVVVLGDEVTEPRESKLAGRIAGDTVVVNDRAPLASVASLLVPVADGPHSGGAVDAAAAVARANDAWLELVHVDTGDSDDSVADPDALLEAARERATGVEVDTRVVEADDVADAIVAESEYHDVTVIGAPASGRLRRLIFGSTAADVREDAHNTVVMTRHGTDPERTLFDGPIR